MRLQRQRSSVYTRANRRRFPGCLPNMLLLGLLIGVVITGWDWIERQFIAPPNSAINGDLGNAYGAFNQGDLNATIGITQQVWQLQPTRSDALLLLVRSLIYRSYVDYNRDVDREIALDYARLAYENNPTDPDVMTAYAFALQATLQPIEAADLVRAVLQDDPDHVMAWVVLGLSYGGVGGYERALAINAQIDVDDDSVFAMDVYRARAIHFHDLGRYLEAISAIDNALDINSRLITLHFERAQYTRLQGLTDSSVASYFRVMAFDSDNVKARLRMCELASVLRESENALDYCGQVTQIAPRWSEGWYRLGREYFLLGEYDLAAQSLNRCTSLEVMQGVSPEERRFECWYLQGQAAEILGDCDTLLHTYEEFREMTQNADIAETWVYPPEGPAICVGHSDGG